MGRALGRTVEYESFYVRKNMRTGDARDTLLYVFNYDDNGFAVVRNHLERRITGFAANRQHTCVQGLDFRGRGFFREHECHHHHQSNNHTQQLLHCYHPPENRFFTILLSAGALPGNSA